MWIRATTFERLLADKAKAEGSAAAHESLALSTKTTMDWLMVRLTQLEHERAQLLYRYMDVKITTPVFEAAITPKGAEVLSDIPSFTDVGDEQAKALGLGWDAEGRATQYGKAIE